MRRTISVLIASLLAVPPSAFAQTFKILGTRATGMGGAGVAAAEGGMAQYWNPAGLALQKGFDVQAPVSAGAEFTKNLLEKANGLSALSTQINAIQSKTSSGADGLTLGDYQTFLDALNKVNGLNQKGLGLLADAEGGGNVRIGRFAFSVNNFTEFGADPYVDTVNMGLAGGSFGAGVQAVVNGGGPVGGHGSVDATQQAQLAGIISQMTSSVGIVLPGGATAAQVANELIFQADPGGTNPAATQSAINQIQQLYNQAAAFLPSGVNPFAANQTSLTLRGASVTEASMGMGGGLPFVEDGSAWSRLSLGANAKYLQAQVGYATVNVLDKDAKMSDLEKDFRNNLKTSSAVGLDLGLLYDLQDTGIHSRFGLTARNVNRPRFDQPQAASDAGADAYRLDPQVRAGWSWKPLGWFLVAADVDVTDNNTSLPGYKSRMAGGGAEVNVFNRSWLNLALRGGLMKNVAESSSPLAYTAGLGLNLFHVHLDVGGAVSSKRVKIDDGTEVPASVRVAAELGVLF